MFSPKISPLEEAIGVALDLGNHSIQPSKSADPYYSELAYPIIALGICPILKWLPPGRYCLAGGAVKSVFEGVVPTDIDVFILGNEERIDRVIQVLKDTAGVDPSKTHEIKISQKTCNKTIKLLSKRINGLYDIQIIGQWYEDKKGNKKIFKTSEEVLETFDIVSACFAIEVEVIKDVTTSVYASEVETVKIVSHPLCIKCLATKELMVSDLGQMDTKRMRADRFYKYITEYGYRIKTQAQMSKFNELLAYEGNNDLFEYL